MTYILTDQTIVKKIRHLKKCCSFFSLILFFFFEFYLFFFFNCYFAIGLHDLRSAFRVRFRSRGAVLGVEVAVLTSDSNISSSPSVKVSSYSLSAGERCTSGRRRRKPAYGDELSRLSMEGLCDPNNCLKQKQINKQFEVFYIIDRD